MFLTFYVDLKDKIRFKQYTLNHNRHTTFSWAKIKLLHEEKMFQIFKCVFAILAE